MAESTAPAEGNNQNCSFCEDVDGVDDMVQCDVCDLWAHYRCAGVTEAVKNESWSCSKCSIQLQVPKPGRKAPVKKGPPRKTGTKSDAGSDISKGSAQGSNVESSLQQLYLEQEAKEKELEEQKLFYERRLEIERSFLQRKRAQQQDMLLKERQLLEKRLSDEREFLERQQALRTQFRHMKLELSRQFEGTDDEVDEESPEGAADKVQQWMKSNRQDPRGAYPKQQERVTTSSSGDREAIEDEDKAEKLKRDSLVGNVIGARSVATKGNTIQSKTGSSSANNRLLEQVILQRPLKGSVSFAHEQNPHVETDFEGEEIDPLYDADWTEEEEATIRNILNRRRQNRSGLLQSNPSPTRGPTQAQLAARQAASRHLPIFKGEPEVWPLFISCFEYTTAACGYTNTDNLKRLQDSLQGFAKEAVQSRLLLPESVPEVVEDLRKLFGNPEKLLKTLVAKVRNAQAPRLDKLETFLYFGITVKQLCDHLEAAGLRDHLSNPMLVQELVSKLPPSYKLDWVRFKRGRCGTPLRIFTDFTNEIVSEVSEVTEFTGTEQHTLREPMRSSKPKRNEYLHAHTTHGGQSGGMLHPAQQKSKKSCVVCKRTDHKLRFCDDFVKLGLRDRAKVVEKHKLCPVCLNDHGNARCTFNVKCNVNNCRGGHHPLLHRAEEVIQVARVELNTHECQASILFRMIPITLYYGENSVDSIAFLDEGASTTLVESTITDRLNAEGIPEPLVVVWTANMKRHEDQSRRVNLSISSRGSDIRHQLAEARTVTDLVLPQQSINFKEMAKRFKHLRGLPVIDYNKDTPRVLIGLDNLHLFAPLESRVGGPGEPIAVRSTLGWTVYGVTRQKISPRVFVSHHSIQPVSNEELHEMLGTQYRLEESCTPVVPLLESNEDQRAREVLEKTTIRIGDRFETGLIWKEDYTTFPDSYPMAMKRLKALERRLAKNPELQRNVFQQIVEYQQKGYCHKASKIELGNADANRVWYLPLNVVLNPKKPGKIRLVWDAAATVDGVSLNSRLLKGPDLLTSLPSVICKFRERAIAFGGDVREMYHQLRIREADKSAQRFLFRFDPEKSPDVYVMDVATFGSTSSPCSAQFIKNRNAEEYAIQFPDAARAIIDRHYVDDYYDSLDTEDEAVRRAKEVRYIHSKAGFEIRNWASNSTDVLSKLGESNVDKLVHFSQDKTTDQERVLGLIWDTVQDVLSFSVPFQTDMMHQEERPTKRQVLSAVMSLFDPLGLLAPFTVLGKMLIQDLWRTGCEWDELIDDESYTKWRQWTEMLPEIERVRVPRSYFGNVHSDDYGQIQLHVFCDAGENAYGCAGYLRIVVNEEVKCSLVMARSKIAPLKQLTIPRLELQAAVLAARMVKTLQLNHSLEINRVFIWSDSQTVLSWIRSDQRKYKQFVGFRIGEILSLSCLADWRWLPSKLNTADCLTKWGRKPSLESGSPWFNGHDFIHKSPDSWPQQVLPPANTLTEMRATFLFHHIVLTEQFMDVSRVSKWNILVRTVTCLFRFVSNCRRKGRGQPIESLKPTEVQAKRIVTNLSAVRVPIRQAEFKKAEEVLFKMAQSEAFGDEIKTIRRNQESDRSQWITLENSSVLRGMTLLLDDSGVLRLEGRSANAEFLPFDLRFPIILPKANGVTEKLVQYFHERFGHAFRETVKNELKQRFLIPKISSLIAKVEKQCVWCKIHKNRPHTPRMAALPVQRLTPFQRPFTYVGVDYLGPVDVTVGRRTEKRWVVVFTCLVVRAIHLEVAHNLTGQSCVMAIRRFICRRGPAAEYFSDNGTNLRSASKEMLQQFQEIKDECAEEFTNARTKWHFNPPATPHMGGVWERMVRTVKEVMSVLNDGRRLNDEILLTSLSEAEDMINSRPLTFAPQESSVAALSPNMFLRGVAPNEPQDVITPTNVGQALRDSYKRSQQLADNMWRRWIKEYIPSINQRNKWFGESKALQKGDLVYVVEGERRKVWIRGIVEELIVSSDGRVRQAMVRTNGGLFRRATANLAVLEINEGNTDPVAGSEPGLQVGELLSSTMVGKPTGSGGMHNSVIALEAAQ
ncbi:uncharacterized protein LOC131695595 [Topomyia yanbarensis]|uniref:uncharacterized protein LOC131695595 n=1 Tax=Topomyia yanbarensis TaxID=2498891 RepID=UPI00273C9A2C|nr:uncharacterized protein LOC131695595 [Topomyia yanbarensis]